MNPTLQSALLVLPLLVALPAAAQVTVQEYKVPGGHRVHDVWADAAPGGAGWSVQDAATGDQRRLNYRSWRAGLGVEYQFGEAGPAKFWVFAAGGIQFGQELEWKDGGDTLLESDLANGQFLSGGLRLRF